MYESIQVLVLEDEGVEGLRVSTALAARGVKVHVVDSCARAMNKMLEYMDIIVVDARARGVASRSVESLKTRVATTPVVVVGSERELRGIRCQGRVRADAYVELSADDRMLVATLLETYAGSARNGSRPGRKRRFSSAA